jgi:hypothetical protein
VITGASVGAGALLGISSAAAGATFQVDRGDDQVPPTGAACTSAPNDCTLRGAIDDANSNANPSTIDYITFASSVTGTITLSHNQLPIMQSAYVEGPGANVLTISGDHKSRIFFLHPTPAGAQVSIYRLTLTNGTDTGTGGGAVYNNDANMKIAESVLTGNSATQEGGAVYDSGYSPTNGAGDIIYASTISGNTAGTLGGGIYGLNSIGTLSTSTVTGNQSGTGLGQDGGGVYSTEHGYVIDSTIAGNGPSEAGGGLASANAMTIYNSILADNTALVAPDFYSFSYGTSTASFSVIENGAAVTTGAGPNIFGVDPQLAPLANNGGATPTMKPATTSPVIDQGHNRFGRDQRFLTRTVDVPTIANAPGGNGTDIGAVELQTGELPSGSFSAHTKGTTLLVSVTAAGSVSVSDAAAPLSAGTAKKKKRKLLLNPSSASGGPPAISVKLRLTKLAKQKLREKGKVTVNARITFTPNRGIPTTVTQKLKIKGKKKK